MRKVIAILFLSVSVTSCSLDLNSPGPNFHPGKISPLYLEIDQEKLEMLRSQKLLNYEVPATWNFRGSQYRGVIRPQGAGSRYYSLWSYTLFPVVADTIFSPSIILSAQVNDRTKLRTLLMTELCRAYGVWTPECELVTLWLNGEGEGVYYKVERIDESYFRAHGLPVYELIKVMCSAPFTFQKSGVLFSFDWQIPKVPSQTFFGEFLFALDTVSPDTMLWRTIGRRYIDIPQYLRFHALNVVVNNVDGLRNNFYFYRASSHSNYEIIAHDFDNAFSLVREVSLDAENEIIVKLLQNDSCRVLYFGYLKELVEQLCTEERLFPLIDAYSDSIQKENSILIHWDRTTFRTEVEQLKRVISKRRLLLRPQIETLLPQGRKS